jgi:hypothetical protein
VRDPGNGEDSSPPGAAEEIFLGASSFPRLMQRRGVVSGDAGDVTVLAARD